MTAVAVERRKIPAKPKKTKDGLKALQDLGAPTPERMAKMGENYTRGDLGVFVARDAPLETLHAKKVLSGRQYDAGKKFYHHWYRAGLNEKFAALNLASGVFGGDGFAGGMPVTEAQAHHRDQYRKSSQRLGMRLEALVLRIVCLDQSPAQVGMELLGWTNDAQGRAAATEMLKYALDILADHYGL